MRNTFVFLLLLSVFHFTASAQKQCIPYMDQNGVECSLVWNSVTGVSKLYFYNSGTGKFAEAPYQLPAKPTGDAGSYQFHPYIDKNGVECVLTYNATTGTSKLYFYNAGQKKFTEAPYQLPAKPTGDAGVFEFHPYIDQNGVECILASNATTGTSKLFFYNANAGKFTEAPYQLPAKPTGDAGTYQFHPYIDKNGVECVLTSNAVTGTSKLYFYNAGQKKFTEAPYQLPAKPTGDAGVFEFHPYVDQNGVECILASNATTGSSKLYFYNSGTSKFTPAPYQLPAKPTGDAGSYQFHPYIDKNGVECVLTSNATTGSSRLYFYKASESKFVEAPYQLAIIN